MCFGLALAGSGEIEQSQRLAGAPALRVAFVSMIFVAVVIARGQFVAAKEIVDNDPVIGVWTLDRARSTFTPDVDLESRTITFTAVDSAIRQTTVTYAPGSNNAHQVQYTARYNQKDYTILNSFLELVSLKRIDRNTVERIGKVGAQVVETDTRRVSPDGKTLTITTRGIRDGVSYSSVQVFDRVS